MQLMSDYRTGLRARHAQIATGGWRWQHLQPFPSKGDVFYTIVLERHPLSDLPLLNSVKGTPSRLCAMRPAADR